MFKKILSPRISEETGTRHIGHHVMPIWFEEGFFEIMKLFSQVRSDTLLIMKSMHIDYIAEVFLFEDVEVITGVKKIGTTSLVLDQRIYQGGRLCVKGTPTFVYFDYNAKKTKPIPPDIRLKLEEHMVTD